MVKNMFKAVAVCVAILCVAAPVAVAQETSQQRIMDAVMQVYADELKKNPNDFSVLYSRASQYFLNGDYNKALDDVNAALRVTTRDDMDVLVDEYVLRSKIYNATGKQPLALADLQEANKLNPSSSPVLTMLAEAYYANGDYANARNCYLALYRRSNINYVAILGLARAEAYLNNAGRAEEYANQAVELYPAEKAVYIGRAEVLQLLGRNQEAAQDLIMALSISDGDNSALSKLMEMSDEAYGAVVSALDAAIQSAPGNGMFYYIKSSVQVGHCHYADGLRTLQEIISRKLYDYHGIYYDAAEAAYNLCRFDDALAYIDTAISMEAGVTYYYVMKSQVLAAMNRFDDAYISIKTGLATDANNVEAMYQKALLDIDAGEYRAALQTLNEILMVVPTWQRAKYMRGWVQKEYMNDEEDAKRDFSEILLTGDGGNGEPLRGFALLQLGRNAEAASWCRELVAGNRKAGGEACYVAAVVMAQCGNADAAIGYMDKALSQGFGSRYDVMRNESPLRSLEPIRHLEAFKETVDAHAAVFE